ncbi:MAG: hypothetical protein VKJ04_01995 [Vampirovibrionales bacterium]|nr:hypothetical protein [Vampirovibrionales bacterium]
MTELTPEEKEKIYLEEKARREAQQKLEQEEKDQQARKKTAKANEKSKGCLFLILGLIALPIIANVFNLIFQFIYTFWIPILFVGMLAIALRVLGTSKKVIVGSSLAMLVLAVIGTAFVTQLMQKAQHEKEQNEKNEKIAAVKANPAIEAHIKKANALLKKVNINSKNFAFQRKLLAEARAESDKVPADLRAYTESQSIQNRAAALENSIGSAETAYKKAHPSAAERIAAAVIRQQYASKFESMLLEKGIDAAVTTSGRDRTTITVKYVLMNRPLVYSIWNNQDGIAGLKAVGFKKLITTDGYSNSWSLDL